MTGYRILTVALTTIAAAGMAHAGEWDLTGFVGVDGQAFWLDGRFPDQNNDLNGSIAEGR